jgi:amidase
LKTALASVLVAPFIRKVGRAAAPRDFDPGFGTVSEAARAIRSGVISSRELVEHTFKRIKAFNSKINAFITLAEDSAMARAREADEALAAGKPWGPLHGLPVVIKDCFQTAGVRTTAGSKMLAAFVPKQDAVAVARLKRAGAILVGKTNTPELAGDVQAFNEVAGTTNNPWDLARTPGGSTGGGAAALAAGFGFLELGSDIGGSIRTPCHFSGVFGHKPTLNLVPVQGHIPPLPGGADPYNDLNVAGPMARSAQDLRLALEILGGPAGDEARAYRWSLPAPRGASLKDYRIGYVVDDPFCPLTAEVKAVIVRAVEALRKQGAKLKEGWPEGVKPQTTFDTYLRVLSAFFSPHASEAESERLRSLVETRDDDYAKAWLEGAALSHREWIAQSLLRLKSRDHWQQYFTTHDAFLMPENFITAFPHDHNLTFFERRLATSDGPRHYGDVLRWICFATLSGCPATAAPVGRTESGLPVGIQVVGPYLEDVTPIDLAGRIADVLGGFEAPPGYTL